jgi:hypothetical protein
MGFRGIRDMLENTSFENNAALLALPDKPWQIDGGVDANRSERGRIVNAGS